MQHHVGAVGGAAGWQGEVRQAKAGDADDFARLAAGLAMSFEFSTASFRENYPALLAEDGACLLLAVDGHESIGYLLGFRQRPRIRGVRRLFPQGADRSAGRPNRWRASAVPATRVRPSEHSGHFDQAASRCPAR
jgi:hypothetical protein